MLTLTLLFSCGNIKGEGENASGADHNGTEGLAFDIINDTECAVRVGTASLSEEIVIPSTYKTYNVSIIYDFVGCNNLKSITIPNSVTRIECGAFADCTALTSITIPDSVTSIGDYAFAGCESLTSITLPFVGATKDGSEYTHFGYIFGSSWSASYVPSSLKSVVITGGTSIWQCAFKDCTGLASVTIGDGVTSIGSGVFGNCTALTSVTIPDSVTSIDDYAFVGCTGLTSITIPDGMTSIGYGAFAGCTGLTSITIGNGVTSIGSDVFENCTALTSITIPNSVTSIGSGAFENCTALASITIPDSVTSIGSSAFAGCESLTSITLPFVGATKDGSEYTHFGYIFGASSHSANESYVPSSLKSVVITGGTSIASYAFYECNKLMSITIPSSVTSIGDSAFIYCLELRNIKYRGTESQWYAISNGAPWNGAPWNVKIIFEYTED